MTVYLHQPLTPLDALLEAVEKPAVLAALAAADWNQRDAARLLVITRRRLDTLMRKYGIVRAHERTPDRTPDPQEIPDE